MEKWIQKLSGAVIASVLALTLNSRASADLQEDDPDPDQPLPQIEEEAPEEEGAPGADSGAALTYTAFSSDVDSGDGIVLSGANDPEGGPADTGDSGSDTEPGTVSIGGTTFTPGEDAGIDLSGTTTDDGDLFGFDAGDPDDASDDSFYMVNYNGSGESLSSEDSDINIVAAGLNQLGSILADGNVNVTGTGILLVDQIQVAEGCGFFLHPIEGMYDSGSVAVFLLTSPADSQSGANAVYTLLNPESAPGILDESYVIPTGIDLVMPSGTSLLLPGMVVAEENGSGNVSYFFDSVPDGYDSSQYSLSNNNSCLTIPAGSSLTVSEGASITMTEASYDNDSISPTIEVQGDLTVNGEIRGGGRVFLGSEDTASPSVLSGSGTIGVSEFRIRYAARVDEQSSVLLDCPMVYIFGNYDNCISSIGSLNIRDACVQSSTALSVGSVTASGDCMLNGVDLCGDITVAPDGSLALSHDMTVTGTVSGGTVIFLSGSFTFSETSSVSAGTVFTSVTTDEVEDPETGEIVVITHNHEVFIYNCSGSDLASFFADPGQGFPRVISPPASEDPPSSIPYSFMDLEDSEAYNPDHESAHDIAVCSSVVTGTWDLSSGPYSFSYDKLMNLVPYEPDTNDTIFFSVHYADENGNLCTISVYSGQTVTLPEGSVPIAVDGFNRSSSSLVFPANEVFNTQTSATGSGIIGGSGAGSISGGTGLQINIPTGGGNNNGNNENGNGNNENGSDDPSPVVNPQAPQQDVTVSVTELSASDPQAASLEELQPVYSLSATADGQVLTGLSGSVTVRFSCPAPKTGGMIFAVFRAEDGSLKVFRARYDRISGQLVFQTDMLGDFAVVCIDYDGELYSDEFYALLESFDSVRSLR